MIRKKLGWAMFCQRRGNIHKTREFHSWVESKCLKTRSIIPKEWSLEGMFDLVEGHSQLYEGMIFPGQRIYPDTWGKTWQSDQVFTGHWHYLMKIWRLVVKTICLARDWIWHWSSLTITTCHHCSQIDQWEENWTNEKLPNMDFYFRKGP